MPVFAAYSRTCLGILCYVGRLRALLSLDHVKRYGLTFGKGLEALPLDGRVMDEHVPSASVRFDETIPLRFVEPLHFAARHKPRSLLACTSARAPLPCRSRAELRF